MADLSRLVATVSLGLSILTVQACCGMSEVNTKRVGDVCNATLDKPPRDCTSWPPGGTPILDAWDNPMLCEVGPSGHPEIVSLGRDGKRGGSNWSRDTRCWVETPGLVQPCICRDVY